MPKGKQLCLRYWLAYNHGANSIFTEEKKPRTGIAKCLLRDECFSIRTPGRDSMTGALHHVYNACAFDRVHKRFVCNWANCLKWEFRESSSGRATMWDVIQFLLKRTSNNNILRITVRLASNHLNKTTKTEKWIIVFFDMKVKWSRIGIHDSKSRRNERNPMFFCLNILKSRYIWECKKVLLCKWQSY